MRQQSPSSLPTGHQVLSHVVLLIRQISYNQPPAAFGHLGVAKVHQVPPSSIRWKAKFTSNTSSPTLAVYFKRSSPTAGFASGPACAVKINTNIIPMFFQ